ncbi:MAG: hypothetical protein ACYC5U_06880 [Rhodocyclaceae bacterium]
MNADLMREYALAADKFEKTESDLTVALNRLDAARDAGDPAAIASTYRRAQQVELECAKAFEVVEQARRAVWLDRARQAEAELERLALPLLSVIHHCQKAGAVPLHQVARVLSRLGCLELPPVTGDILPKGDRFPPIVMVDSLVLDRAEESNIAPLRGGLVL